MPRRGSKAKEVGSVVTGGATTCIFSAGTDEVSHHSGKNEEIPKEAHSTSTDQCPPG
jgi:hypothetical protein